MSIAAPVSIDRYDELIRQGEFEGPNRARFELIRGEILPMIPIGFPHEDAVDYLTEWSFRVLPKEAVRVRVQNSVGLPELASVPEPDLAWVARKPYSKRPVAADVLLLIEVADSSIRFDRSVKAKLYAEAGLTDYWIVNIPDRCVEVFREPVDGAYRTITRHAIGDEIRPLAFPAAVLHVAELFAGPA